ncbi:MAG: M28 family peptidase [Planctomycetota bacterium]
MSDTNIKRLPFATKRGVIRLLILALVFVTILAWFLNEMFNMPGDDFTGDPPPLDRSESTVESELKRHVITLAETIGERHTRRPEKLAEARDYISVEFREHGYEPRFQTYEVSSPPGTACSNVEVEILGTELPKEIVIIGGHYDSVVDCPGANDNGTGTAAVLELARLFSQTKPRRTLRFVAFVNEEPPYFQTDDMGSVVYAKRCRENEENVVAMISVETIGYYTDEEGSQKYPSPLFGNVYGTKGDFVGFISNFGSRDLLTRCGKIFREKAKIKSQLAPIPDVIPGIGWSDHWSFWQEGYSAIMVTDTATFRYPHYHEASDTPEKIDFTSAARVVSGLEAVVEDLVNGNEE